jgi:LacI family transcriptional regulator
MVTIKDVARESGFSVTTVSMVLNDAPLARYIPQRTKNRVKKVAEKLAYRPNSFARSLRSRRSMTVGVLVPDVTDPFCTQILKGVENGLYTSAFLEIMIDIQNDRERFSHAVEKLLDRRVEGLVMLANSLALDLDLLDLFVERQLPVVTVARSVKEESVSSVMVDNEAGAAAAMKYLYDLGHRKFAFIKGPRTLLDSMRRWKGIREFARTVNLPLEACPIYEMETPTSSSEPGYNLTRELIAHRRKFTALVTFDDLSAFGAVRALTQAGLRIPEDCSVMGFDDIAASAYFNPPITTIRQPMETLGSMAIESLLDALNGVQNKKPLAPVHRQVKPDLVVRQSTGPVSVSMRI